MREIKNLKIIKICITKAVINQVLIILQLTTSSKIESFRSRKIYLLNNTMCLEKEIIIYRKEKNEIKVSKDKIISPVALSILTSPLSPAVIIYSTFEFGPLASASKAFTSAIFDPGLAVSGNITLRGPCWNTGELSFSSATLMVR